MSVKMAAEEAGGLISQEEPCGVIGRPMDRPAPGAPDIPLGDAAGEVGRASSGPSAQDMGLPLRSVPPPTPNSPWSGRDPPTPDSSRA